MKLLIVIIVATLFSCSTQKKSVVPPFYCNTGIKGNDLVVLFQRIATDQKQIDSLKSDSLRKENIKWEF